MQNSDAINYNAFMSYSHHGERYLARSVEKTLSRFGRRWFQLRGIRIYRDETNLAASPDLWTGIQGAVRSSKCLLLLASPDSARSKWVPREVASFIEARGLSDVLIIQTSGVLPWTDNLPDGDLASREDLAINMTLHHAFERAGWHPFVVDLRPFRDMPEQKRQRSPEYLSEIANIAAKVLEKDKEEIWGAYYRAQRLRNLFLASTSAVLLALLIGLGLTLRAENLQRKRAEYQSRLANSQTTIADAKTIEAQKNFRRAEAEQKRAETERERAEERRQEAERERARAEQSLRTADARRLAVTSAYVRQEQPVLSLLLAREALRKHLDSETVQESLSALWRSQERIAFKAHSDEVSTVQWSPVDDMLVTVADKDHVARIWNADGHLLRELTGHPQFVTAAAWGPDGKLLTGSNDGTARVWKRDGGLLCVLNGHSAAILAAAWNSVGDRLVTVSRDKTAILWHVDGHRIATLRHDHIVRHAVWQPKGAMIVTTSDDGTARMWDSAGNLSHILSGHTGPVWRAAWSADGETLTTVSLDGTARLWTQSGTPIGTPLEHGAPVLDVAWQPHGSHFATVDATTAGRVWARDGRLQVSTYGHERVPFWKLQVLAEFTNSYLGGGEQTFPYLRCTWNSDGDRILIADTVGRVWDTSGNLVATFGNEHITTSAAFNRTGDRIAAGSRDGSVRILSPRRELLTAIETGGRRLTHAEWAPDGNRVLVVNLWDSATVWDLSRHTQTVLPHPRVTVAHWDSKGDYILTCAAEGSIRLWDRTGALKSESNGTDASVCAWNSRGDRFITASSTRIAHLWRSDGKHLRELSVPLDHPGDISPAFFYDPRQIAWSPSGDRVLTTNLGGVFLWKSDGELLSHIDRADSKVTAIAWVPAGGTFVLASRDGVRQFDQNGRYVHSLIKGKSVRLLQLSPNGQYMATVSNDGNYTMWTSDGMEVTHMSEEANVISIGWSADSRYILGRSDAGVSVWTTSGRAVMKLKFEGAVEASWHPSSCIVLVALADGTAHIAPGGISELLDLMDVRATRYFTSVESALYFRVE